MKTTPQVGRKISVGMAALTALLASTAAYPQAFQGTPATSEGSFNFNRTIPGQETILVTGVLPIFLARATLTWTGIPAGNPALFLPPGAVATFSSALPFSNIRVINRLSLGGSPSVLLDGGLIGTLPGTVIEFETTGGEALILGSNASVSMPHLLLRAPSVTVESGATFAAGTALSVDGDLTLEGAAQIGNGDIYGEVTGNILLVGGALTFNRSDAVTYGGLISGNGHVVKEGGNVLTLTGANTYVGSTSINVGVLSVSSDANLGDAASGLIFDGGALRATGILTTARAIETNATATIDAQAAVTLTGIVSGVGGLTKTGTAQLFLSNGANSYLGPTTIVAGALVSADAIPDTSDTVVQTGAALALSASDAIGSLSGAGSVGGDGAGDRTLIVGGSNGDADFTGVLSDIASGFVGIGQLTLVKTGAGTQTLSATNSYSGGTTVNEGTLRIDGAATLGAVTGETRIGGGAVDLGGTTQTQNGGFVLTGGELANGVLESSGMFDLQEGTVSGALGGVGAATKSGAGTVLLAGNNTYAGLTTVNGGTLIVNGSIASSSGLAAAAGTRVGGSGFLPTTTIGGTLAPGNSIGTITVNGQLTFAPGSTYEVEVSPGDADRTDVKAVGGDGSADLSGATVMAVYEPGSYVARQYVIISAEGGLKGTTFAGLNGAAPAGFTHKLAYEGSEARLVLEMLMAGGDNPLNPFANLAANQQAVADALVGYFNANGGIPGAFAALSPQGLTANSGELGAAAQGAGMAFGSAFIDTIGEPELGGGASGNGAGGGASAYAPGRPSPAAERFVRMSYGSEELAGGIDAATNTMRLQHRLEAGYGDGAPKPERFSVWGAALGGGTSLAGNAAVGAQALSGSVVGLASGFDYANGSTRAGIALGASWSSATLAGGLGNANVGNASFGLRVSHDFGRVYIAGAAAYGVHFATTTRAFAGETYWAAFTGQSVSGRAEIGARLTTRALDVLPFAGGRIVSFSHPAYTETGSGAGTFALAYNAASSLEARSELGIRLHKAIDGAGGGRTIFSGMAGWAHYFSRGGIANAGFVNLPGTAFATQGATGAANTALVSLGVSHRFANGLGLSLNADGEFGAGTIGYAAKGRISWSW